MPKAEQLPKMDLIYSLSEATIINAGGEGFKSQFRRNKDDKDKLGLFSAGLGGGPGGSAWDVTLRIQEFSERALREGDVLDGIRGVLGAMEKGRWRLVCQL